MEDRDVWIHAVAAVDMNLSLGDVTACEHLHSTFLQTSSSSQTPPHDLMLMWRRVYGMVPPILHDLFNVRFKPNQTSFEEIALFLARTRITFLTLPASCEQIVAAAHRLVSTNTLFREHRHKRYVHTHANIMASVDTTSNVAAAHAFLMHTSSTTSPPPPPSDLRVIHDAPPSRADHLNLPSSYLGVDVNGHVWVLHSCHGTSSVQVGSTVPHEWMVRVSKHANQFLAGNHACALLLTLNENQSAFMETAVLLPRYPTGVVMDVDKKWVVWKCGTSKMPRAMEWNGSHATLCSVETARFHAMTVPHPLTLRENEVWVENVCIARLPASETITVVWGTPVAFDALTQNRDWWRVDVRAKNAWVVGVSTTTTMKSMAPLIEWE